MSITATTLTLILESSSGTLDINYPVPSESLLTLTNVLISFDSAADSATAGPVLRADLGALTSHVRLNGNLENDQVLILTNNDTLETSRYSPQIPIGLDNTIPSRLDYKITNSDRTPTANIKAIILQFSIVSSANIK